ncbi:2-carboxy-1,4-naphthoquinone phytyltransferase, chloroplastic-like isoform X1 [Zingiber officinale]|uniref:2-carboxy-1,4-naphthoquinone phytyltransferase, chloroplastic-like isoform X1 n=1 Tax=Zingiber officinale TaxID=94328 RepID=UPI001C4C77C0|nr:2-carboxy-1,4-naphthoquinone phytyltransferase, chloroplastic-like isoform X1 [Zingiber officinale]
MAPAALTPVTALPPLSHFISSPSLHTATLTPLVFRRPTAAPSARGSRRAVSARRTLRPLNPRCSTEAFSGGDGDGVSRATLLWRAAKLPIYSVALVPLTVGTAAAYHQTGLFFAKRYLILLSASVLVITWLNLSNDVYDFDTGADRNKKESVVNILGSRGVTQFAAITSLVLSFMGLFWACADAGNFHFILLVTFAILCGYVYQCPPFRLSYLGLGEPLCFAAFGPFATTSFYFSSSSKNLSNGINSLPLTSMVLASSFLVGLTTTLILFCSHFHQIDEDLTVGKMSPLVRIGTRAGSQVVKYGVISLYILLMAFSLCNVLPLTCLLLAVLTIPMGKLVIDFVEKNHNDKIKIFMAKYYCVRLHAFFGSALAVGLFLARTRIVA